MNNNQLNGGFGPQLIPPPRYPPERGLAAKDVNMKQLPDIGASFAKMQLQERIAGNGDLSLFGMACAANVYTDYDGVIQMIQDQLKDNPALVVRILGADTVLRIDALHGTCLSPYQRHQLAKYGTLVPGKEPVDWNGPLRDYRAEQREAEEQQYDQP